ncbi:MULTISPECIES: LytTR family transcriptional regulator DNA-binding domain-containing protein [Lactiplantibacillus]|uniref:LytTR family transcriptional regulator DNA-binding domain-containing protein n=1 Tax=Lactiplantibacillus TaxID=2767842 RepID=UPI002AB42C53|nr:LytTR family transcriptional regulator DNA-binding domain-containing protein [Lactiplantibacillus plantarum]MDY8146474.1 LytTR family transcriptional regulator DNA-binding domain-containing protein [Lactiplantibacillus plantarum]
MKINDIVYAVINQGELTITTTQGKFIAHETLNWLKSHLDSQRFIQVHHHYPSFRTNSLDRYITSENQFCKLKF